ncbi:MAG: tetratricopeptide repeat protein, partial [Gammaproteobacteria bacterium]|nr:tetratricopeptide repeat protein [Gammaproteobacteria bacterium]
MTSNMQTSTVDQLLQQGMELARTGKTETAIHKYQEALRQSPDNPYAQHLLG